VILGQTLGAFVGVCCSVIFENYVYLGIWVSVSVTLIAMVFTKSVHPPAGTTAIVMILGSAKLKKLEFMFILMPTLSG
jgi:CBS domain-containing membrane protein